MKDGVMTVAAGPAATRQIALAYRAGLAVLLHGRHGVGKSELLHAASRAIGIDAIVRDLSLMEPPDLLGLPRVESDGRTHYAAPAFLPRDGKGLLVFEEINRAPRYMVAPCLQLLTARTLNDYELPAGWVPCAAINDGQDGYDVNELDPALLSRFVRIRIEPDVAHWAAWARDNGVHAKVVGFVEDNPNIFQDPRSNPRAWTYVSKLLHAAEASQASGGSAGDPEDLVVAIAGLVGETWSGAFAGYDGASTPLSAIAVVDEYTAHRAIVRRWRRSARLDLLEATWVNLRKHLQRQATFDAIVGDPPKKKNAELFIGDLTPDLLKLARDWLAERNLLGLKTPRPRRVP